jgi:DUF971 family protein
MPIPIDVRKKPLDVKIHVSTGAGMDIIWSDTHASHYDFAYLRDRCPCALCNDEREKKSRISASGSGGAVLPIFKPKVTAKAARPVGHYAIQIDFSDGHSTGIFSFEHLREICPCPACQQEFHPAGGA